MKNSGMNFDELVSAIKERQVKIDEMTCEIESLSEELKNLEGRKVCNSIMDKLHKKSEDMWYKRSFRVFEQEEGADHEYSYYHITGIEPVDGFDLIRNEGMYFKICYDKHVSFGHGKYVKTSVVAQNDNYQSTMKGLEELEPVNLDIVLNDVKYVSNKILSKIVE